MIAISDSNSKISLKSTILKSGKILEIRDSSSKMLSLKSIMLECLCTATTTLKLCNTTHLHLVFAWACLFSVYPCTVACIRRLSTNRAFVLPSWFVFHLGSRLFLAVPETFSWLRASQPLERSLSGCSVSLSRQLISDQSMSALWRYVTGNRLRRNLAIHRRRR